MESPAFSEARRQADPGLERAYTDALRRCVHCGFCLPACPTFAVHGDERDGPRGRIVLMRAVLETDARPAAEAVKYIDRCIGCLACAHTCPAGVDYAALLNQARGKIAETRARPWLDRLWRGLLARVLPSRRALGVAFALARMVGRARALAPERARAAIAMARAAPRGSPPKPGDFPPAEGSHGTLVSLFVGCVHDMLAPGANHALVRILNRFGYRVRVLAPMCCGSLARHIGSPSVARKQAAAALRALADDQTPIICAASGCALGLRDIADTLGATHPDHAKAQAMASRMVALTDLISPEDAAKRALPDPMEVAWHPPCSLQHGLNHTEATRALLASVGVAAHTPRHVGRCCGAGAAYAATEPATAATLRQQKISALMDLHLPFVITDNAGCQAHLDRGSPKPVVHSWELFDWRTGGPRPDALNPKQERMQPA